MADWDVVREIDPQAGAAAVWFDVIGRPIGWGPKLLTTDRRTKAKEILDRGLQAVVARMRLP